MRFQTDFHDDKYVKLRFALFTILFFSLTIKQQRFRTVSILCSSVVFPKSNCPLPRTAPSLISIPFFILKSPLLSLPPFSPSPACSLALCIPPHSRMYFPDSSHYWRASSLFCERVPNSLRNTQEPLHFMIRVYVTWQVWICKMKNLCTHFFHFVLIPFRGGMHR